LWDVADSLLMDAAVVKKDLPFPYLTLLLNFDTSEFLRVLSVAFDDPSLSDTIPIWPLTVDLSVSDSQSPKPKGQFLNRQMIIDILLRVMTHSTREFSVLVYLFVFCFRFHFRCNPFAFFLFVGIISRENRRACFTSSLPK